MQKATKIFVFTCMCSIFIFSACVDSYACEKNRQEKPIVNNKKKEISEDDIDLIALITMAEAEGECEDGKRLVIDTVLNRIDSGYFPDTIKDVIYQKNQFSSVTNGRLNRCYVDESIRQLVKEELKDRISYDVIFFNSENYSNYGVPLYQVQNHYFSSYD